MKYNTNITLDSQKLTTFEMKVLQLYSANTMIYFYSKIQLEILKLDKYYAQNIPVLLPKYNFLTLQVCSCNMTSIYKTFFVLFTVTIFLLS